MIKASRWVAPLEDGRIERARKLTLGKNPSEKYKHRIEQTRYVREVEID